MNFYSKKTKKIIAGAIGVVLVASMVLSLVSAWI